MTPMSTLNSAEGAAGLGRTYYCQIACFSVYFRLLKSVTANPRRIRGLAFLQYRKLVLTILDVLVAPVMSCYMLRYVTRLLTHLKVTEKNNHKCGTVTFQKLSNAKISCSERPESWTVISEDNGV